jgi:hypothetical protein
MNLINKSHPVNEYKPYAIPYAVEIALSKHSNVYILSPKFNIGCRGYLSDVRVI